MGSTNDRMKERILNKLDAEKDEIINLCSQLVKIPSENPPGMTTEIAAYLKDFLIDRGIRVRVYEPKRDMSNLIATFGAGERPNLVMNAHMDEFPAGEIPWNAFGGEIRGGKIIGRGSSDMKGGLTASLVAFTALHEICGDIPGKLTLTLVSDEETGGRWGTGWLLKNVPEVVGDACLIGEATGTGVVATGEKGVSWFEITSSGTSGHGAHGTGENAIEKMVEAIPIMLKMREMRGHLDRFGEEFVELLKHEAEVMRDEYGEKANRVLEYVTVNLGTIMGGTKINIVPSFCELQLDIRLPFGLSPEDLRRNLETELERAGLDGMTCDLIRGNEGTYTSRREKIVEIALDNVKRVTGQDPVLYPIRLGATDAHMFRTEGVPTVIYGPKAYNMAAVDEHITVKDLITVTKVHASLAFDFYEW